MRRIKLTALLTVLLPLVAAGAQEAKVFRWVDENGVVHFGDSIPAKYAELPKQVLNEHGVAVEELEGKKTPEQIEAERIEKERLMAIELRKRADQALLATYLTVEEIMMHRDRRVELFQAQSKVTELYLSNLSRRMENLREYASRYSPYSEDPDAAMIPEDLANDLRVTKDTIARHERNLKKFLDDEKRIISRFAGDISRFKELKGIE
tara:strand:- start:10264 stop:10887 length:624 start_codon:yes stop_codon:yes gene_type:complete